jgi:hypothetical protein
MEQLEKHFHSILTNVLDLEASGARMQQSSSYDRQRLLEEGQRIRMLCKNIKDEVKRIEQLDEQFRNEVDQIFRIH